MTVMCREKAMSIVNYRCLQTIVLQAMGDYQEVHAQWLMIDVVKTRYMRVVHARRL